jgi:hypothetical protein
VTESEEKGLRTFDISIQVNSFADRVAAAEAGARCVIEFSFLADLSLPLPVIEAVNCFQQVLGGTTVKPEIAQCMLPLWLHGVMKGDARFETAAFGPLLSPDISFVWDWFTRYRKEFRLLHLLPLSWHAFADEMKDLRLGLRELRVLLLAETINRTMWNRREAAQHAASDDVNTFGGTRRATYTLESDCEASAHVNRIKLPELIPGDWRTYPPYYPGDHTVVARSSERMRQV